MTGDGAAASTFGVVVERRSFNGLEQKDIVDAFAKAVPAPHKVNLGDPEKTVLVQLIRNVCAVAVAPRFKELCKYNVKVAAEDEEEEGGGKEGAGGGQQQQQQQEQEQQQEQQQEEEEKGGGGGEEGAGAEAEAIEAEAVAV
jgi:hypothetical protein